MVGFVFFKKFVLLQTFIVGKPKFLIIPQAIRASAGDEVRLDCKAVGSPEPTITWSRNGVVLALTNRHILEKSGTLVIKPVQTEDYGTYRCDARNKYGRVSAEAEVIINGTNL